jgi:hypothetical protein
VSDREELASLRGFADEAGLPSACPEPECRKSRRCRAARRACVYLPHFSPPPCLAVFFDEIYFPVARYRAFRRWLEDVDAKLKAMPADDAGSRG